MYISYILFINKYGQLIAAVFIIIVIKIWNLLFIIGAYINEWSPDYEKMQETKPNIYVQDKTKYTPRN